MKNVYWLAVGLALMVSFAGLYGSFSGDEPGALAASREEAAGLEITGDARVWQREHVKALDEVYDGTSGRAARGDLMGFYFDQEVDRLSLRVSLFRPSDVTR